MPSLAARVRNDTRFSSTHHEYTTTYSYRAVQPREQSVVRQRCNQRWAGNKSGRTGKKLACSPDVLVGSLLISITHTGAIPARYLARSARRPLVLSSYNLKSEDAFFVSVPSPGTHRYFPTSTRPCPLLSLPIYLVRESLTRSPEHLVHCLASLLLLHRGPPPRSTTARLRALVEEATPSPPGNPLQLHERRRAITSVGN